jgi:hypothetical protein
MDVLERFLAFGGTPCPRAMLSGSSGMEQRGGQCLSDELSRFISFTGDAIPALQSCVKLRVMPRRSSYFWALGAFLVAAVLGFNGRASHTTAVEKTSPASSPPLSKAPFESAALCEALIFQFHGCTHPLPPKPIFHEFRFIRIRQLTVSIDTSSELHYFPLQRRPPPSLS